MLRIILDLSKSINNYEWNDKEELKEHIKDILDTLNDLYNKKDDLLSEDDSNRVYDMIDMFSSFEIE